MRNTARASWTRIVTIAAMACAGLLASPPVIAGPATWSNPVIDADAADPFIFLAGGTYYAYTTNTCAFGCTNIPVWTSTDLVSWTQQSDALPNQGLGRWVDASNGGLVWAPSVLSRTNAAGVTYYVLYYTARANAANGGRQCIGAAISYLPQGPFVDPGLGGPLVCQAALGGSIDASPVVEHGLSGPNPQAHLFWKSDENAVGHSPRIWSAPLAADGYSALNAAPRTMLTATAGWEGNLIEGPSVVYDRGSSTYVMLYAANWYNSVNYATGWATCSLGIGGFTGCTRGATSNPLLQQNAGVKGPGGAETFTDAAGALWLVYHGYHPSQCPGTACGGARQLRIDRLTFSGGVPVTAGPTTTAQAF